MTGLLRVADAIDAINNRVGQATKWLAILLVLTQFVVVVLRYAYATSYIWMQESVIYIHAMIFMLAIGYTYLIDAHVRVDIYLSRWSTRTRAWVELIAVVVTVMPFCILLVWASWTYVLNSWRIGEGPMAVGGLPLLPWLKSLILIMAFLLALQGLSVAIRALAILWGRDAPLFPRRPAVIEPI
jgi:TRAP-type mannitol/chloroaromatic compound transport system permease small subunit